MMVKMQVDVSFEEVRNSQELPGTVRNPTESDRDGLHKRADYFRSFRKKSHVEPPSRCDSDEPTSGDLRCPTTTASTSTSQSDPVKKNGLLSWKRRRLSSKPVKKKVDAPLIPNTSRVNDDVDVDELPLVGPTQVPRFSFLRPPWSFLQVFFFFDEWSFLQVCIVNS